VGTKSFAIFALLIGAMNVGVALAPPRLPKLAYVPVALANVALVVIGARRAYTELELARRKKAHHCINCGYDLRATPERCPECGTAVAPKPAEAAA
jgi:hypothetical protein